MAMLMVLLATRMVLSSLSGFESSLSAVEEFLAFACCSFSMSVGVREKYATSDPEIKAEAIISMTRMIISVTRETIVPVITATVKTPAREPDSIVSKISAFV